MAIKILAGDFKVGGVAVVQKTIMGNPKGLTLSTGLLSFKDYKAEDIESVAQINQQNHTSIMAKLGWGGVGVLTLGPLGLLAGALGGGNKSTSVVGVEFTDGKRVLLEGNTKEITHVIALGFGRGAD